MNEEMIQFIDSFCKDVCGDLVACEHVFDSNRCDLLFDALKENGFINEQLDKIDKVVKESGGIIMGNFTLEEKEVICRMCNCYNKCNKLENNNCGTFELLLRLFGESKINTDNDIDTITDGYVRCKACGRKFELDKTKHYLVNDTESGAMLFRKIKTYDAFDCPFCQSQYIAGERLVPYEKLIVKEGGV